MTALNAQGVQFMFQQKFYQESKILQVVVLDFAAAFFRIGHSKENLLNSSVKLLPVKTHMLLLCVIAVLMFDRHPRCTVHTHPPRRATLE